MGMAASQARFLGLTARKNNVEFEGQQINQQRTTLSNQSANYYNDLLGMSVPVPPSVDDYTKTVYTFQDGALSNQITAMIAQPNGEYIVSYLRQWTDDFSVVSANTSIINKSTVNNNDVYKVGNTELREMVTGSTVAHGYFYTDNNTEYLLSQDPNDPTKYDYTDGNGSQQSIYYNSTDGDWYSDSSFSTAVTAPVEKTKLNNADVTDDYLKTLSAQQLTDLMKEEDEYIALLQNKYGQGNYMVRYIKNTTTGEYEPYFYKKSDLTGATYDVNHNSKSHINCYKIGSEKKSDEVKALKGCQIEKDSSGRYINLTIPAYDASGNIDPNGNSVTYALTTTTATDQAAYEDAMNQYEFEKQEYDQAVQEINAKIEIVQSQDKNLELRLKQLDTEQKAISTEIDAVSQVIQKNTESSFKTFG